LSVSYEDQRQAGEENDATILDLQQAAGPHALPSRQKK
jgi:hypothetical protein